MHIFKYEIQFLVKLSNISIVIVFHEDLLYTTYLNQRGLVLLVQTIGKLNCLEI